MVRLIRSLFCALLAVLVAMVVAPEPLAHAAAHLDNHAAASGIELPCADHISPSDNDDSQAPKPCGDCCHHATCGMKAAPAAQDGSLAFNTQSVRFCSGDFVAPYGAPNSRDPDPERS